MIYILKFNNKNIVNKQVGIKTSKHSILNAEIWTNWSCKNLTLRKIKFLHQYTLNDIIINQSWTPGFDSRPANDPQRFSEYVLVKSARIESSHGVYSVMPCACSYPRM